MCKQMTSPRSVFVAWVPLTGQAACANPDHLTSNAPLLIPVHLFLSAATPGRVYARACACPHTERLSFSLQMNDLEDSTATPPARKCAPTVVRPSVPVWGLLSLSLSRMLYA